MQTDLKLAILCATLMGSSLWRYWALRRASCFLSAVMEAYLGMTSIRTEEGTEGQEAAHDGGGGQSHAGLLRGQVDGLLVVVGGHGDVALPHRVGRGLVIVQPPLGPVLLLGTRSASLVYH